MSKAQKRWRVVIETSDGNVHRGPLQQRRKARSEFFDLWEALEHEYQSFFQIREDFELYRFHIGAVVRAWVEEVEDSE